MRRLALLLPFAAALCAHARSADVDSLSSTLDQVEVTAQRRLVSNKIDRVSYDVGADPEAKTDMLDQILRKVPLVTVEADGTIRVRGTTNFRVYKNGRPNQTFSANPKEIFQAIPASSISRIEVITDPGASEDAEGAGVILNIVTVRRVAFQGVKGNVGLNMTTRNDMVPNPNAYLTTQIDRVTLTATGSFKYVNSKSEMPHEIWGDKVYDQTGLVNLTEGYQRHNRRNTYGSLEASWEPDTLNLLTVEAGVWNGNMHQWENKAETFYAPGNLSEALSAYQSCQTEAPAHYLGLWGSADYQRSTRRQGETITLSYRFNDSYYKDYARTLYENTAGQGAPYSQSLTDSKLYYWEQTFQADWHRPLATDLEMGMGAKCILRRQHSDEANIYVPVTADSTDFHHNYTIGAAYADVNYQHGPLSARLGLRYEYSHLSAEFDDGSNPDFSRNLHDLVPDAALQWQATDSYSLRVAYSTSISRPNIEILNPAERRTPTDVVQGNPRLKSQFYQTVETTHSYFGPRVSCQLSASLTWCNNVATNVIWSVGEVTHSSYAPNGRQHAANFSFWGSWQAAEGTQLSLNGSAMYSHERLDHFGVSGWSCQGSLNLSQRLPWSLRLSAWAWASTPTFRSMFVTMSTKQDLSWLNYGLSLQRSFLQGDRLTARVTVYDPFLHNHSISCATYRNRGYLGHVWSRSPNRVYGELALSFRFGNLSTEVRKAAATIENTDSTPLAGE